MLNGDIEEITRHRGDPALPVEEPDRAFHDIKGLGECLVKVRIGA
jgi:hypothetical protein